MSLLRTHNIEFIPSIHQRIAFAEEVRRAVQEFQPDCIAVELPQVLGPWIVRGALRLPQVSAVHFTLPDSEGAIQMIPIDPCDSMIEAVRLAMELGIDVQFIDTAPEPGKYPHANLPDDLIVDRAGLEAYVEKVLPYLGNYSGESPDMDSPKARREAHMAHRLNDLRHEHQKALCVIGMAHFGVIRSLLEDEARLARIPRPESAAKPDDIFLAHLHPSSLPEVFQEIPHVACQREENRLPLGGGEGSRFDKPRAFRRTFKEAEEKYAERYHEEINLTQYKGLFQFTRNLAFVQQALQPDTYTLVMGAKGAVDGDYGYEVYETARSYKLQEEDSSLAVLKLKDGQGEFSDREGKHPIELAFDETPREMIDLHFRRRPTRQMMEMWQQEWNDVDSRGICSWPPEDVIQERFMTFLRKRALQVLCEDKRQVQEFTTSLLDGLDIRETMRNWHEGKLYVQQTPQPQGKVAAVILIFAPPEDDEGYPWRETLYAENNNESDIAFYATPLGLNVVGPRISRTEFGGILSIYPAINLPNLWREPALSDLETCADVLLAGGILCSPDRFIAYIAHKPPSSKMRNLAAQYKKKIIHLPIQGFSPSQLKKIRKFHILNGRDVRDYAADYIFDD